MQNGDEALSSSILAGLCILVKMLATLEPHHIFLIKSRIFIHVSKLAGKMTKKRKKYKEKYWLRLDSNHCAYKKTSLTTLAPRVVYYDNDFTDIMSAKCGFLPLAC